ncbi:glycosyltransferase family 4 protein [Hazenella sp. IB182357]|uniref:Glycosyltransferase family 4 protein n=1 Tax=Polycladospora coralii TaxID=2771432 RepID=A0A926N5X5_9BACL|nr:glycosyltransferase family 4 protein [Polycladospora coralii]MBD1372199.1 glycosyltransferase family 4 protein [Polycladospora coralii]
MRIWLANHYAVPPNIAGITRHYELAKEWAEVEEAEVTLFLSKFVHPRRTFVTQEEKDVVKGIKGLKLKWLWSFPHRSNDFKRIINMGSFALMLLLTGIFKRKPDVLIASSPHLFTAFSGWMLAKLKRCSFILEVRDLWPDSLIKMGGLNNKRIARLLTWMESFLYHHADQIIVLTEHQRQFIADKGINKDKIDLIPNGIVVSSWTKKKNRRQEIRQEWGVAEDDFVAIYTGAHGPANALEYVVRAGEFLNEKMKIVLIGDGPEKERLIKLKEEQGLEQILLLPPVPKSDIFDYTQAADCGIISLADNEVFRGARPNKLFDYTFIGLPIISTVDGEVREIIEKNEVGIFAGAENPEGIASSMEKVMTYRPEQLEQIKVNGRSYIDREGDRKKLAHRFFEIMQKLQKNKA